MARTKSVLLRLSEEEYARLKELAGREPMNAYLRRMALGEQEEGTRTPATLQALKHTWYSPALTSQFAEEAQPTKPTAAMTAEDMEKAHDYLRDKYDIPVEPPQPVRQRCTAKGCTWTTTRGGAERCPKHGFSNVVDV